MYYGEINTVVELTSHHTHCRSHCPPQRQRPVLSLQCFGHGFTLPIVFGPEEHKEGEWGALGNKQVQPARGALCPAELCPGKMVGWEKAWGSEAGLVAFGCLPPSTTLLQLSLLVDQWLKQ